MKTTLKLLFIFQILMLTVKSYAVPMNGIYTIGPSGDFATIGGAVVAVTTEGVSGLVTFKIMTGTYPETNSINPIPFASVSQPVIFESMAGNPDSVIISGLGSSHVSFNIVGAGFLVFQDLTLEDIIILDTCSNIVITDNKFISTSASNGIQMEFGKIANFSVTNNTGLTGISNVSSFGVVDMLISGNSFMQEGFVVMHTADGLVILRNTGLGNVVIQSCNSADFSGNKLSAFSPDLYPFQMIGCSNSFVKNNFICNNPGSSTALFQNNNSINCHNNTFQTLGFDTTVICINNDSIRLRNNIYDNDSGGISLSYIGNTAINSDYNTYNNGGAFDYICINGSCFSLLGFQNNYGQDLHSVYKNINFVSPCDLHLHPIHAGDEDLLGAPDPLVTVDIDGEPRHALYPYKGADELDEILPVELSSFTASVTGSSVLLVWTTSSENNNSKFEIEKSDVKGQMSDEWIGVGFVNGNGTTNSMHQYNFVDKNLLPGKYKYRLKQIDYNGNFTYYNLSNEVEIGVPAEFSLKQNYPNPFNPETNITFDLPSEQFVKLNIYDISGRLITQLVNEVRTAGRYSVKFNAANLSSGIYFYEITSGNFTDRKKMIIQK